MSAENKSTPALTPEQQQSADEVLRAKLNLDAARIPWNELQRHFAAGRVVRVSKGLDLIDVAFQLTRDNHRQFQTWLQEGLVSGVEDAQAQAWCERQLELWAIVVAPWVLVQDPGDQLS